MGTIALEAGNQLLHHRLIEQIGAGGMGVVWRARDTDLDREVAIKVLPASMAEHEVRIARFRREAKLLASLNHPNIAVVQRVGDSIRDFRTFASSARTWCLIQIWGTALEELASQR